MTDRQRIAHLLRRFGFGAGKAQVDQYEPLGGQGTIDRLLNYETVDEQFPVRALDFAAYEGGLMLEPPRFAAWWALRMVMSQRPLQEKLTLFWHNHFAVSAAKVFEGMTMLRYQEIMRNNAGGSFRELVHRVSKDPAMIFYLDTHTSRREHPNENFARELLELFTMGKGYTEQDIQEASRAFCGWSLHYSGLGDDRDFGKQAQEAARKGRSVFDFCLVPAETDTTPKTILGQTRNFMGDEVLDLAISRTETSLHIARKLSEWFVGEATTPALVEKVASVFAKEGNAKAALRTILDSEEFWKPNMVVMSPADFTIGFLRSLGIQQLLVQMAGSPSGDPKQVRNELVGVAGGALGLMAKQGLTLFYPPNVGGWPWGRAWITPNNMAERINMARTLFVGDDPNHPVAAIVAAKIASDFKPTSAADVADGFLALFDADELGTTLRTAVVSAAEKGGGPAALGDNVKRAQMLATMGKLVFAAPGYHVR